MVGNVAGLYSFSTSNVVVPSNNNTGLYNDTGGFIPVSDDINISGNITAGGYIFANGNIATNSYFIGDGSQITNISANSITGLYGNANVSAYLASGTNTGNIITVGNISGNYILGNAAFMSGLPSQYSNANVDAYLPIYTGNIRAGNLSVIGNTVTGNLQTTGASGNITGANYIVGNFFVGDGSLLSNINVGNIAGIYSNANVIALLESGNLTSNIITSGNIQANVYLTDGYYDSNFDITSSIVVDTVDVGGLGNAYAVTAKGVDSGTGNVRTQAQLTPFGLSTAEIDPATGITTGGVDIGEGGTFDVLTNYGNGNLAASLSVVAFANAVTLTLFETSSSNTTTITPSSLSTGEITATANITGAYFIGDGSQLTGLPASYSNANVATFLANFGSNVISTTGNITAGTFAGSGAGLTAIPGANITGTVANATYATSAGSAATANSVAGANVTGQVANALVAGTVYTAAQPNITSVGTLTSLAVSGNITANNISTTGNVSISGSLESDDITATDITVYGNQVITGNLTVQGNTTTINSNVIVTNDKTITVANNQSTGANVNGAGIEAGNPAVATWLYSDASTSWQSNISITPNANLTNNLGTNTLRWATVFGGDANLSGNVTAVNVTASSNVAAANVVATYLYGDGSNITGVTAGAADLVYLPVKNTSGGTLTKGTPVYATGTVGSSTTLEVSASRADTASTMGAIGLLTSDLINNATGQAISIGSLTSINTSTYTVGQQLYVAATGGLTNSRPTGSNLVQLVGTVGRVNASTGSINVNIWDFNQLPNLGNGNVWVGNATGYPTETVAYGNSNVTTLLSNLGSNVISSTGNITTTGNVSGTYILGNVAFATGIPATYGNANVANFLANYGSNVISSTGNITTTANISGGNLLGTIRTAAQPNITSLGTLSSLTMTGNLNFSGTMSASGGNLSVVDSVIIGQDANVGNRLRVFGTARMYSNSLPGGNYVGFQSPATVPSSYTITLPPAVGSAGQFLQTDASGVTTWATPTGSYGNANVADFLANGFGSNTITTTGNISGGNLIASANVLATGNVSGSYILGNGSQLTGIVSSYGNANVTALLASLGSNAISSTANITTTANVAGAYFIGNGSALTGITSSYGNANVATFLANLGSNIISSTANITTTGNVSGGNILGIGSNLTGINAFGNVAVAGQTTVSADNTTDTLTLVAGTNITITTDAPNNKITITSTATGGGDTISPFLLMGG